ncbi:MAG: hypothetical protein ACYSUF_04445 [Planctomycetota bacterium]
MSPPSNLDSLFVSIFPGAEDLHLEASGHRAGNRGTSLSIDFTNDIDNETRIISYDLGADEAIPGVATAIVLTWQEIEP